MNLLHYQSSRHERTKKRLSWAADTSGKRSKQSFGLMVNYLYDRKKLDKHRALLAQGKIPVSTEFESLVLQNQEVVRGPCAVVQVSTARMCLRQQPQLKDIRRHNL